MENASTAPVQDAAANHCISVSRVEDLIRNIDQSEMSKLGLANDDRGKAILNIGFHYDMLARNHLNRIKYYELSNKIPQFQNDMLFFAEVHDVAMKNNWNPELYLEAQFVLAQQWERQYYRPSLYGTGTMYDASYAYPLPYMLLSEQGEKWFIEYTKGKKGKKYFGKFYNKKPMQTITIEEEIANCIITDVDKMRDLIYAAPDERNSDVWELMKEKEDVAGFWSFSPYYLWSFKWYRAFLDSPSYKEMKENSYFGDISSYKEVQKLIMQQVKICEFLKNIPPNIDFDI